LALALVPSQAPAQELPEYRLKAAFLYNFALFTEWPADLGPTMHFCVLGADPFGAELDVLKGKRIGDRTVAVHRKSGIESLKGCHVVFITSTSIGSLRSALDALKGAPVLTVADSPGAAQKGVALNMLLVEDRIAFEANPQAARAAGVNLSAQLLRLARVVHP
jgi:hypothetical protein